MAVGLWTDSYITYITNYSRICQLRAAQTCVVIEYCRFSCILVQVYICMYLNGTEHSMPEEHNRHCTAMFNLKLVAALCR